MYLRLYSQQRKKIYILISVLIIIILLIFGFFASKPKNKVKNSFVSTNNLESFFESNSDLRKDTEDKQDYKINELKFIDATTVVRAEYPTTGETYLDRQIAMSVQNAINNFRYKNIDKPSRIDDEKSALKVDFKLGHISNRVLSVLLHFQEKDQLKEQYSNGHYEVFQFDRFHKRFLSLEELFKNSDLKVIKEKVEESINKNSLTAKIKLEDDNQVKNILFKDYTLEIYIDENRLAASQIDLNPTSLSYRSLDKDLNFFIDERNHFIFDPLLDPRKYAYKPKFFTMPNPYEFWPANPEAKIKYVALSFNSSPTKGVTEETIKILKEHDADASFFINGNYGGSENELIKMISDNGYEIGNLGNADILMTTLGMDHMRSDFKACDDIIFNILGYKPTLTRSLYGDVDDRLVQSTASRPFVLWNIDAQDWSDNTNTSLVTQNVMKNIKAGSVILMQNRDQFNNLALNEVLNALSNEGYRVVSISELYKIYHADFSPGLAHHSVFDDQPELWDELIVQAKIASGYTEEEARTVETTEEISKALNMG